MKRLLLFTLLLSLCLTACGAVETPPGPGEEPPSESALVQTEAPEEDAPEAHTPSAGGNVAAHEEAVYCGNTVTTVTKEEWAGGEPWTVSFWGSDSIALTDLLRFLDYSGDVCRCLPEYTVDTEFGGSYGVNLTESYARCDGGQTALTAEQVELIQGILDRQTADAESLVDSGASETP